jgi:tetratricopeptide (TPR) repeat protein
LAFGIRSSAFSDRGDSGDVGVHGVSWSLARLATPNQTAPTSNLQFTPYSLMTVVMTPENEKRIEAAMGYFELGMLNDATQELEVLGHRERLSVLSVWSAALRMARRWPEMLSLTRKMVELYPDEAECWISLADATRNSGSLPEGLSLLETAHEHFPNDGHILFQIACYCCQLGRLDEARNAVRRAVSCNRVWKKVAIQDRDLTLLWPEIKSGRMF